MAKAIDDIDNKMLTRALRRVDKLEKELWEQIRKHEPGGLIVFPKAVIVRKLALGLTSAAATLNQAIRGDSDFEQRTLVEIIKEVKSMVVDGEGKLKDWKKNWP